MNLVHRIADVIFETDRYFKIPTSRSDSHKQAFQMLTNSRKVAPELSRRYMQRMRYSTGKHTRRILEKNAGY